MPATQGTQSLSAWLPTDIEYLPAPQKRQVAAELAPVLLEYLPTPHGMQSDSALLPWPREYLPAVHPTHVEAPSTEEYLPTSQSWQVELLEAPDCPERFPDGQ